MDNELPATFGPIFQRPPEKTRVELREEIETLRRERDALAKELAQVRALLDEEG